MAIDPELNHLVGHLKSASRNYLPNGASSCSMVRGKREEHDCHTPEEGLEEYRTLRRGDVHLRVTNMRTTSKRV